MNETRFYVFELASHRGVTPYGRATDGGVGAFMFSSPDKALDFADSKGHRHDWHARELDVLDALEWLQGAKDANGVTDVWIDPNPQDEGWTPLPVDALLDILRKAASQ